MFMVDSQTRHYDAGRSARHMKVHEFIETEIVILSPEEGGRSTSLMPVAYGGHYRPHIVLQSRDVRQAKIELQDGLRQCVESYLGISFWDGPTPIPVSRPFMATLHLDYAPNAVYDSVMPDATFTIREGHKIIGHGKVLRRWKESDAEQGAGEVQLTRSG